MDFHLADDARSLDYCVHSVHDTTKATSSVYLSRIRFAIVIYVDSRVH